MGNILNMDEVASEMLPTIGKALRLTNVKLLFPETRSGDFKVHFTYPAAKQKTEDDISFSSDNPAVVWLANEGQCLETEKIGSIPQLKGLWTGEKTDLSASDIGTLCPIRSRGKLIGILALGRKEAGTLINPEDLDLVITMASQASVIIENAQLYASATERANLDELTGLFNHRHFHERLDHEIARDSRSGTIFSLVMIDIDRFKDYNDTYGHLAGDQILGRIGKYIQSSVRSMDVAFRYGGEEFAVILPETGLGEAFMVAERIRKTIGKTSYRTQSVTASLGVATWPIDGVTREEIIACTDASLYRAKQTGRNLTCLSSDIVKPERLPTGVELEANTIYALAATVDAKDHHTYGHSKKVSDYAVSLAETLNLPEDRIAVIRAAGLLHDLGKIGIHDSILRKESSLTDQEWEEIRDHPRIGVEILKHVADLANCLPSVMHHHERYDGNGYPFGLKGNSIPIEARILSIADTYDAITSPRTYREQLTSEAAINELKRCAGTQFDPELVDTFCKVVVPMLSKELEV
jgi:diguanylate cyclase (GGDEF)-like protein/putative nucleotidyltransferase with HDIG domain